MTPCESVRLTYIDHGTRATDFRANVGRQIPSKIPIPGLIFVSVGLDLPVPNLLRGKVGDFLDQQFIPSPPVGLEVS